MNIFRRVWRALRPHSVQVEPGNVFVLFGHKDDPFRGHFSVTVVRLSDDGNWVEFQYRYGSVSSLRRDIFVSTYERACYG